MRSAFMLMLRACLKSFHPLMSKLMRIHAFRHCYNNSILPPFYQTEGFCSLFLHFILRFFHLFLENVHTLNTFSQYTMSQIVDLHTHYLPPHKKETPGCAPGVSFSQHHSMTVPVFPRRPSLARSMEVMMAFLPGFLLTNSTPATILGCMVASSNCPATMALRASSTVM